MSRRANRRIISAKADWRRIGWGRRAAIMRTRHFSNRLHCAECDLEYREPSPALFSFNHPAGACPACKGFGRVIAIDYNAAIPDRSKQYEN